MAATTVSLLTGFFKERYGKLGDLVPRRDKFQKLVPFVPKEQQSGNSYHVPVIVSDSQGYTYAGTGDDGFSLNDPVSMITQDAQILGSQIVGRVQLGYNAAARASDNVRAFGNIMDKVVENMVGSNSKRLELVCLYGQSGIGQFAIGAKQAATSTTMTINMTRAKWAAGIWAGLENAEVNFYTTAGVLVSSGADAIFTVTSVDSNNRRVKFTGTATGIADLDTSEDTNAHNVFFRGAQSTEAAGIDKIFRNTGSLFNIDASVYDLWRSNVHTVSGQFNMAKLLAGITKAVDRGLSEDVVALVNPHTWQDANADLAALRSFDKSYKPAEGEAGNEGIIYHGTNGKVELIPHIYVKEGDCFFFPPDVLSRVGAQDFSTARPGGGPGDDIFFDRPDNAAYEMRSYTNQGVLCEAPAMCGVVDGFTNS